MVLMASKFHRITGSYKTLSSRYTTTAGDLLGSHPSRVAISSPAGHLRRSGFMPRFSLVAYLDSDA